LKFVEYTTTAFAVILISFMVYVSFNDFRRIALFKSMFQSETRVEPSEPAVAPGPSSTPASTQTPGK
jgi:hypothetical protein